MAAAGSKTFVSLVLESFGARDSLWVYFVNTENEILYKAEAHERRLVFVSIKICHLSYCEAVSSAEMFDNMLLEFFSNR